MFNKLADSIVESCKKSEIFTATFVLTAIMLMIYIAQL